MSKEQEKQSQSIGLTLSNEQTNSDSSRIKLIDRERIEGTPFLMVTTENGSFLMWGDFVISEKTETKAQCKKLLKTHLWKIIAVYVASVMEAIKRDEIAKKRHNIN